MDLQPDVTACSVVQSLQRGINDLHPDVTACSVVQSLQTGINDLQPDVTACSVVQSLQTGINDPPHKRANETPAYSVHHVIPVNR